MRQRLKQLEMFPTTPEIQTLEKKRQSQSQSLRNAHRKGDKELIHHWQSALALTNNALSAKYAELDKWKENQWPNNSNSNFSPSQDSQPSVVAAASAPLPGFTWPD